MLKRIAVGRLVPGMHIQELCGSWMDHPFWRKSFKPTAKDIERIVGSGVAEAWIDTDKGLDVADGAEAEAREAVLEQVEEALAVAASAPMPLIDLPPTHPERYVASGTAAVARVPQGPSPLLVRAQAKAAVSELFKEARMGRALDIAGCLPVVDDIIQCMAQDAGTLLNVLRIKRRDEYTYLHSVAVCALMVSLARTLGFDAAQCQEAGLAGLLHDIGKARVPLALLSKPGRLTDAEFKVIRAHPAAGHDLLRDARVMSKVALDVSWSHHEKVDGSGYPRGLRNDEISLFAKMGAVCDVYDAVTSNRPYKECWDPGEALREMAQWRGHFDTMVFRAFVKTVGIYPLGSLVRLASDRLAMVVEQHDEALLLPGVQPLYVIASRQRLIDAATLDLRQHGDRIVAAERPAEWAARGFEFDEALMGWKIDD